MRWDVDATIRNERRLRRETGPAMLFFFAVLAVPVVVATVQLFRKRNRRPTYRPTYRPGGPLPRRQSKADRVFTVDRTSSPDRSTRAA